MVPPQRIAIEGTTYVPELFLGDENSVLNVSKRKQTMLPKNNCGSGTFKSRLHYCFPVRHCPYYRVGIPKYGTRFKKTSYGVHSSQESQPLERSMMTIYWQNIPFPPA